VYNDESLPDVDRFSSLTRLIRSTAYVHKFIENCRMKIRMKGKRWDKSLTCEDLTAAEFRWYKAVQWGSYHSEMQLLKSKKPIGSTSSLLSLSPYIENGLMRVGGRLSEAKTLGFQTQHPIILAPQHSFTKLLINFYHIKNAHCGKQTVLNEIRQKIWIPHAHTAVRSAWNHCNRCKILRAKPNAPEMGPLPRTRVTPYVRPFSYTGIDYFGPYSVTVKRHTEKRYVVIFTCLTTRAVHLELANSLSTDSCIMAISRFISRRGQREEIYSDNEKNFRGAVRELRESYKLLDHQILHEKMSLWRIKWRFNPPAALHMGGSWESLVKSIKTALRVILNQRAPREEVLQTVITEAEAIINSRPLTHVSLDHRDAEALTPNHFLMGTSSVSASPLSFPMGGSSGLGCQWRISQRMEDQF